MNVNKTEFIKIYEHLKCKSITSPCLQVSKNLFLKLELNLPTGSYKIRGAQALFTNNKLNSFKVLSAGNLALACAHLAKEHNINLTAVVPDKISSVKELKLKQLGAEIEKEPFGEIWDLAEAINLVNRNDFLHPLHDDLLLGYGTIILETIDQIGQFDNIIIPYGLGGLVSGIVRSCKAMDKKISIYLVEVENHSPFSRAVESNDFRRVKPLNSFIEAMGTPNILERVFLEIKDDITSVITVDELEVKSAIRELYFNYNLKAEGAAGAAYAAAKSIASEVTGRTLALLTGSNISDPVFQEICNANTNN